MIEILDKVNDTYKQVKELEFAIHPLNDEIIDIKDFEQKAFAKGFYITGVIFEVDGTTIILYKKLARKVKFHGIPKKWSEQL